MYQAVNFPHSLSDTLPYRDTLTSKMAKTKSESRSKRKSDSKDILRSNNAPLVKSAKFKPEKSIEELLTEAAELLERSQPEDALALADEALQRLEAEKESTGDIDALLSQAEAGKPTIPPALVLNAEIHLALGDVDQARSHFLRATNVDLDGALISAEPWLWLAQLCEEGGRKSIEFFSKAAEVMRNEIDVLEDTEAMAVEGNQKILDGRKAKLADALCGMAEVYMTDLSWEADAENVCEQLVTEAVAVCPEQLSAGALQTLASVRISQDRVDDARQALKRSMEIWKDLPPDTQDDARPDFATRVSLARLLMEVDVEKEAMNVLEGLVKEDDQSVEAWYLGGWCQTLMAEEESDEEEKHKHLEQAKLWLDSCLKLYKKIEYEDERLHDHASELVATMNKELGVKDGEDEDWEDEEEEMLDDDDEVEIDGQEVEDDGDVEMA